MARFTQALLRKAMNRHMFLTYYTAAGTTIILGFHLWEMIR